MKNYRKKFNTALIIIQIMQAKGPNALNINAYVNGEEDQGDYMEEAPSSRPNIDVKSIEEQFDNFVKDMQKYDKLLSEVAKNIQDIDGQGQFITDFYPKFISESTYEQDQQKKIIANTDNDLAKIVFNLQKNNKALKEDMRSWVLEFAKTAKLTQVLIGENKLLRQSIATKNKEIVKLIEGIGQAENEQITELQQNLQLLKEQNGVLKQHLVKLKQDVNHKKNQQQRLEQTLQKARQQFNKLQKQKSQAQDEQQHLTKTYQLIQQWKLQTQKSKKKLQREKDLLLSKKSQLQQQKQKIQRQLNICSRQKKDLQSGLKRQYQQQQTEKYKLIEQIHQLGDAISKQKEECRYYDQEIIRNTNKKIQYQKIAKDYIKKAAENQQQLKQLKKELQTSQNNQISLQCQLQLEKYDIEALNKELTELQDKEKRMIQQTKKILKQREQQKNQEVSRWQSKITENQRELAMKILKEKAELSTKQKQLQKWQQKVYDKKEELTDLKTQLKQIKQNQIKLAQLKSKVQSQESY